MSSAAISEAEVAAAHGGAPPRDANPDPHKVGMIAFLVSEAAFFGSLVVAYVAFLGAPSTGPTPGDSLSVVLASFTTLCLVASSVTVHRAETALHAGRQTRFVRLMAATAGLGLLFLAGTAYEWYDLIFGRGLTIGRNMFGTTFFTLVGFHAAHVAVGVAVFSIQTWLGATGRLTAANPLGVVLASWYWHFVDAVWLVVFAVVYLVGTAPGGGR